MNRRHLVILGNGAAALKAAEAIRRLDREATLTLVSGESCPAYSRVLLPYYVGGRIAEAGLFIRHRSFYEELGIHLLQGRATCSLHPGQQQVELSDGSRTSYDELLIATGAVARRPSLAGLDGDGVFSLWSLEDARRLRAAQRKAGHVLILGAGLVGLQALGALLGEGRKVTLVEMADHILPRVLDAQAAGLVEAELRRSGVDLFTGTTVAEAFPPWKGKRKLRLGSGQEIECDLLLLAVGARPNADFLQGSGIEVARGILVDSRMRTNIPHIYAAGDVAETRDYVTGERVVPGIWPVAVEQGEIAGSNMAGGEQESAGSLNLNILEVAGMMMASIGITGPGSGMESLVFTDASARVYRKLVLRAGRVVGAVLVGRAGDVGIIRHWVYRRLPWWTAMAHRPLNLGDVLLPMAGKNPTFR